MRGIWFTLGPMIVAALLVLWGGERLSRRAVEERVPADRERLLDFSEALRGKLSELDALFAEHVSRLAGLADVGDEEMLRQACQRLVGIRSCHVFRANGRKWEVSGKPVEPDGVRPPDVRIEEEGVGLDPDRTVLLPKAGRAAERNAGWLGSPVSGYRVFWRMTPAGHRIAVTVDDVELQAKLREHLVKWAGDYSDPLRNGGTLFALSGPSGRTYPVAATDAGEGPAAVVIPHRSALGEWQVSAWDRSRFRQERDAATMGLAVFFSVVLLLLGVFLFFERRRSVRLAEARVSFVNRVSHELGTPLTNILLNLDLVSRSMERNPEEARRRLGMVAEEARRLARLVANVLTFSRGGRDDRRGRVVSCVPDEVIAAVLEQFQPSLDRRGMRIEWQADAGGRVLADPDALSQIVSNLISNVEKYAAGGGWLGMTSTLAGGRLRVRVADRGPGIPARHGERIFGAFERIESAVNEGEIGTGLGLSIARDLARRGDGELSLVAAPMGAVFELDLPAFPSPV